MIDDLSMWILAYLINIRMINKKIVFFIHPSSLFSFQTIIHLRDDKIFTFFTNNTFSQK